MKTKTMKIKLITFLLIGVIASSFLMAAIITVFYYLHWTNKGTLAAYTAGFLIAFCILVMWAILLDMKVTRELPSRKTNI